MTCIQDKNCKISCNVTEVEYVTIAKKDLQRLRAYFIFIQFISILELLVVLLFIIF